MTVGGLLRLSASLANRPRSQASFCSPDESTVSIDLGSGPCRLSLRAHTSDVTVFADVLVNQSYRPLLQFVSNPKLIVDAGAHIGCASVYFAASCPTAKIIAIEPEESNYALLQRNTAMFPQVECVRGALWPRVEEVSLEDPGLGTWGYRVSAAKARARGVRGVTVPLLLSSQEVSEIDILKIDIEGAEKEVFSAADIGWLARVRTIALETHDRMRLGCRRSALNAVRAYGFREFRVHGNENEFFVRV
ncbi:MAG: FkbM family methyltransferase [Deltaproteobacteria bacterium]|nr:FkbM family methyltransferase [Deltaproteobacteria bacterium]